MDVDSASLSPSSRLSVVCSASAEFSSSSSDSSNFSEGSPPESRRNSVNESVIKDEHYWERRRRNNDASRRSREKRRQNDLAMEEKIMLLSAENERLKSQLGTTPIPQPSVTEPPTSLIIPQVAKNLFPAGPIASLQASSMLTVPLLQAASHIPSMLQLCQLQPTTIQSPVYASTQQPASTSASSLFSSSSSSAFHPFRPSESAQQSFPSSSVIVKIERRSPDSSTDVNMPQPQLQPGSSVIQQIGQPAPSGTPQPVIQAVQQGPSLLSALLSQRRPSPTVPQSRTEHISGLNSPPRHTGNKSDCESVSSSASFSPSHSSEDHSNYSNKSPQYVDRRRRNNEAAKRCRANRRAVFEYRSRRVQLLEGENEDLRTQIETLKAEIAHFKSVLAQRASVVTALHP
ncbi:Transcription factor atf-2 [Caenorhabditis elegans]|uniref:Transcription factor atf-2 n=1 Tax=Caenorhabditis elegans TaxID=6239 RepID=NFIL3_CAEEL|nr:Transcription factor atf-2 [Caenorhabditis elegans]Q21361.1 RecName: Full=Transcription factor atf-2; AltName: Full=cAMP-dependent transcription factor atf-2 [Caenorhabditis elegans]CAA91284.1 Transcription factor atf-2 [Caenorhabditis elegans]|eukprot:NP_495861.1 ATF (cAMP-dependent transcription factor) family [Caenorhabditis elegans]